MHRRTKEQLEKMTPEQRSKAEARMAECRTPQALAHQAEAFASIRAEVSETGGITTTDGTLHQVKPGRHVDVDLAAVGELRTRREALGLSLDQMALSSGVERSSLAKIERGDNPNPTIATLARVAFALGTRVAIGFRTDPK